MFNRCWRWRVLLARRSDGTLAPSQWGSLQDHLASCSSCRKLTEADSALQANFDSYIPLLSQEAAHGFDDRVIAAVAAGRWRTANEPSWPARQWKLWKRMQARCQSLPLAFLGQIGGGAVAAVALTSFFLLPALHPHASVSAHTARLLDIQAQEMERGAASVPMESLLQISTPRAAMLWTQPQNQAARRQSQHADAPTTERVTLPPQPAPPKVDSPDNPLHLHHSALPDTRAFG